MSEEAAGDDSLLSAMKEFASRGILIQCVYKHGGSKYTHTTNDYCLCTDQMHTDVRGPF